MQFWPELIYKLYANSNVSYIRDFWYFVKIFAKNDFLN